MEKNQGLWSLVRKYNELSHMYSLLADELTREIQKIEEIEND